VKVLVNAGADVHAVDTAWHGTPLGWAQYYEDAAPPDRKAPFSDIVTFLEKY